MGTHGAKEQGEHPRVTENGALNMQQVKESLGCVHIRNESYVSFMCLTLRYSVTQTTAGTAENNLTT